MVRLGSVNYATMARLNEKYIGDRNVHWLDSVPVCYQVLKDRFVVIRLAIDSLGARSKLHFDSWKPTTVFLVIQFAVWLMMSWKILPNFDYFSCLDFALMYESSKNQKQTRMKWNNVGTKSLFNESCTLEIKRELVLLRSSTCIHRYTTATANPFVKSTTRFFSFLLERGRPKTCSKKKNSISTEIKETKKEDGVSESVHDVRTLLRLVDNDAIHHRCKNRELYAHMDN